MHYPAQTIPSALLAKVLTTVDINGIATPFNRSLDSLQRFCRPLLFYKDNFAFELAYSGSSFLFRHRGHNFLMCCKHQLRFPGGQVSPSAICFVVEEDGKKTGLPPNVSTSVKVDSYSDRTAEDISLVEYHSERNGRRLDRHFLSFHLDTTATLTAVQPDQVTLIFAIGYPTRFSDYEIKFDEAGIPVTADIVSRWVKLYLQVRERNGWDLESRLPLKVHERYHAEIGDPDGFSGSPVFFIWQDVARQTHLGFAGMITHGSSGGVFQIYPAETIRAIVNGIIDSPETRDEAQT